MGWFIAGERISVAPAGVMAGWKYPPPSAPPNYEEAHPGSYDIHERVKLMDEEGIWAQVIYPNVGGFGSQRFLMMKDPELMLACVQAYNDFLAEWTAPYKDRFVRIAAMPFWDPDACIAEMERTRKMDFAGMLFCSDPSVYNFPALSDEHWDNLWAAAQDLEMPVNFHIGSAAIGEDTRPRPRLGRQANFALGTVKMFLSNADVVADVCYSGILRRYPNLKIVSVESGIGWVPFLLEAMDHQWRENAVNKERPDDLLPSEYFRRQVYTCFWFEQIAPSRLLDVIGVDHVLFETDFPHPTSLYPATTVREHIATCFGEQPEWMRRKVLFENAAALYKVPLPKEWPLASVAAD
ncbi:MAG: amidohydrolase family protein [Dehalococcoidia bacterium]